MGAQICAPNLFESIVGALNLRPLFLFQGCFKFAHPILFKHGGCVKVAPNVFFSIVGALLFRAQFVLKHGGRVKFAHAVFV